MKQQWAKTAAQSQRGFTLIELMVVVAILGILVAIAVPSYQDSVRKSRRGQAKADLVELAQAMERHYTTNNGSYAGADLTKLWGPKLQSPREGSPHYTLSFQAGPNPSDFVLRAVPIAGGSQSKDKCGTLTIDNAGRKTPKTPDALAECWNMN